MKKPLVVITEVEYRKGKEVFDAAADLDFVSCPEDEDELAQAVRKKEAPAVIVGVARYSGPLYEALPSGGVIARFGVGYDSIDLVRAADKKILVTNTPGVLEEAVAEQAVFLAGSLLRNINLMDREMHRGTWKVRVGSELKDKVWAVIGLGVIGRRLSQILSFGFKARVFACETRVGDPGEAREKFGVEKISPDFAEVAAEADVISLHLPANEATRHFLGAARIGILKPTAVLINNARGSLIDESVLYEALSAGRLAGAALDVYQNEPYQPVAPEKDLRRLDNVILIPHSASSTVEACRGMAERSLHNIRCALKKDYRKMDLVPGLKVNF